MILRKMVEILMGSEMSGKSMFWDLVVEMASKGGLILWRTQLRVLAK